jgi:probable O-glycosylation ligase (exosortase A-associated)
MGRINAWLTNLTIASRHVTGGGFEIYTPEVYALYAPDPSNVLVAHSIYFSVLGEHGYIGLGLFLLLWLLALRLSGEIAARAQEPGLQWARDLALMCQVALVGYAVGGAFLSLAYFDLPYNLIVMLVVTRALLPKPAKARLGARSP